MDEQPNKFVTEEVLELKLKKQFADIRLIVIASVALNQFLMNVQLPTAVSVTAVAAAILAPAAKAFLGLLGR